MQSQMTTLRTHSHAQLKQLKDSRLICPVPNPSNDGGKIIRCSNCGMAKLKTKCKNRALAKVLFVTADQEDVTLTIFDDKRSVLYAIYKQQSGQDKEFSQLTEEDLTEMLLQCVSECNHNLQSEQPSSSNLLNCPLCPSYTEQNIETMQILTCQCLIHF